MLADYLHKLYNRGVDIGVGFTTSILVALVGLAFWKIKLRMDLHADRRKLEQKLQIEDQRARLQREVEARERYARLCIERDRFAEQLEHISTGDQLQKIFELYLTWLDTYDLDILEGNMKTLIERVHYGEVLRTTTNANLQIEIAFLRKLFRGTELPQTPE